MKSKSILKIVSGLFLSVLIIIGVWFLFHKSEQSVITHSINKPTVKLIAPDLISVESNSLLEKKLDILDIHVDGLTSPLLTVTGAVMARLRAGTGSVEDRWQFSSIELSSIYADWQRTGTEMDFSTKQLAKTRELTAAQLVSQNRVVERLRKLVATGTEAIRDLTAAEASLLEIQLQGQKSVYESESQLIQATHSHADLERRLLQAGIDPDLLSQVAVGTSLVMADVPEVRINLVSVGQSCDARFYGLPNHVFKGVVRSLAPALSTERRTLRVFFELNDQQSQLKPGMYAEIGLGTNPRKAVLAPADGILHITDNDYILQQVSTDVWRITLVQVGEQIGDKVEILSGLKGGEKVVGKGAILLKPLLVESLLETKKTSDTGKLQ